MRNPQKYFPRILLVEMTDLEEDLELLIREAKKDFESGRITERVYRENRTLYKNEIMGVRDFCNLLVETNYADFNTLDDMITYYIDTFKAMARKKGLANAVILCVERKIRKVKEYVTHTHIRKNRRLS